MKTQGYKDYLRGLLDYKDYFEEKLLEEDIEKLVDGDEESTANEFADTILLDEEDFCDRLKPESHKENLKNINDDDDDVEKKDDKKDDDDDQDDYALIRN
nr:hypothetical protein [Tanacetum cinerariifolium]